MINLLLKPNTEWTSNPIHKDLVLDFSGYYAYVSFTQILFGNSVAGKIRVEISQNGTGELKLPPLDQIQSREIFIEVYSSYGNVVRERVTKIINNESDSSIELLVKVEQKENFSAKPSVYIISGKLIDLGDCSEIGDLQYIIFGTDELENITIENSYILAHGKTSKEGYFISEISKSSTFKKYFIVLELDEQKFYELRSLTIIENVNDENVEKLRIEDKQIIAIENIEKIDLENNPGTEIIHEKSKKDCGCSDKSGKSNTGLSKSESGNCVNFTAPNRTIDEFSFYHVVRTTEPEIKSTFLTSKSVLDIYEDLHKTITVIPPKLISPKVQFELPAFKTETQFKSSIQRTGASTNASRIALHTEPARISSVLNPTALATFNRIKLDDFKSLDGSKFTDLFESKKIEAKADFETRKKALEQEELNINNLIENVSQSLIILRENPISIESNITIQDLIYRIEVIRTAIKNYIHSCEEFKSYFADELNSKILGPSEVNYLSELNKTIKEFQGFEKSIDAKIRQLSKIYGERHTGRRHVNVENEIDWDNTPTVYHNTTIAHGHILHFKQIWKNDGYSIGKVLQSIPLMPGQQKNIAVLEWNRTNISSREEEQTTTEQFSNSMSRDRDVSEVINSAFSENIRASSQVKSKTSGWSVGASVGFPIGPVMVGVSGGYSSSKSSANSSATQDASRNLSANSMNKLRDNIQQSASSLRSQRSTVVQTVSQNESFAITTEVIANYNHCHALTMQYFEILRHILIESKIVDVQECLFVPLPMSEFTIEKIMRWKNTLSGVLLQEDLREGLNAVDRIESEYNFVDFPEGRYADEEIDYIDGEMTISFSFTRPLDQADEDGKEKLDILQNVLESHPFFRFRGIFNSIINNYRQIELNKQKERDAIFENEIVPKIVEGLVDSLVISKQGGTVIPGFDFTLVDSYENKRISGWPALFKYANQGRFNEISSKNKPLRIRFRSTTPIGIKRSELTGLQISFDMSRVGEPWTDTFPSDNKIHLQSFKASYSTHHYNGILASQFGIKDDIGPGTDDTALVRTPLNSLEKRNPRDEDMVMASKLISHLNEYLEFYHKQVWLSMDPNRLFSLVDGYIAPNSGGRSVASVCENQIIGVVGNNLVLKVASGYKLDPTYSLADGATLLEHYQPTTPIDPFHISFPTSGIYAEAVMGACNSCEKIDDTRYWKWEEHPIPNKPTEIQPISTDSRYVDPGNLQTKDLATPMINIQNAPEAPAPTGLGGVFDLMGKSGIFSDMTGLAGNQEIVKEALKVNAEQLKNTQANAVEGMKVAKQIYDSQQANRDSQRKMDAIDQAFPPDGTPEQQAENARLKSALLNKQIGIEDTNSNGMSGDAGQAVGNLSKIDEMVKAGKLSSADGEAMKTAIINGVTNKTAGVINNPAIQEKIGNSGSIEYSSDAESLKINESSNFSSMNTKLGKFIVNFRKPIFFNRTNPDGSVNKVLYEGQFGFDWLRDEYIFPIENVLADFDGNPINIKTPLVNNVSKLKLEYLKDVIDPIYPFEREYYPAWLSMFPPRQTTGFDKGSRMHEAGIMLNLEIEEIEPISGFTNTVEFRSSDPTISIHPSSILIKDLERSVIKHTKVLDSANGISRNYYTLPNIITIKSDKHLLTSHVEIKAVAIGSDKEIEVGKLMIYQNDRIPKAEIVMIRVAYDDLNINLDVQYHDILKNQSFNQALIRAEVIADEKFIINNLDPTDPDVIKFKNDFPSNANAPDTDPQHNPDAFLEAITNLYNKLGINRITDPANTKRTLMFITNEKAGGTGGIADLDIATYAWGNSVTIFKIDLSEKSTFVHEIGHSLSLPHLFSKLLAPHKFYQGYTDNFMDYRFKYTGLQAPNHTVANVNKLEQFFKWQWDIMRQDQSLIDNY